MYTHPIQRRQWNPTPVLLPGKSHGCRSLVGYSPWGCEELNTTEWLHFHFSLSRIGEGNGSPLQCSCLENPRDRGAWWAESMGLQRVGPNWRDLAAAAVPIPFSFKEGLWLASRPAGYIAQNRCSKSGFIKLLQSSGWLIFEAWWATQTLPLWHRSSHTWYVNEWLCSSKYLQNRWWVWQFLKNYTPMNCYPYIMAQKNKSKCSNKKLHTNIPSSPIHNGSIILVSKGMDKQNAVYPYDGIVFSHKKE